MSKFMWLACGTLTGGFCRYGLASALSAWLGNPFPYGTLAVNGTGCLAIGFLQALAQAKLLLTPETRLLLMTGFCGAFTTFSAFILDTSHLLKDGEPWLALANVAGSFFGGYVLFLVGEWLAGFFC